MLSHELDIQIGLDSRLNEIKCQRDMPHDALILAESLLAHIRFQPNYITDLRDLYIETGVQFLELCVIVATEHERAMECSLMMLAEIDSIESPHFSRFLSLVGINFIGLCQNDEALHYIDRAYRIQQKLKIDGVLRSATEGHLGIIHTRLQNYEQAVTWHENSLRTAQKCNDLHHITAALLNTCHTYYYWGKYDKAIAVGKQCVALASGKPTIDVARSYAYVQGNIGDAWLALGEIEKAVECYEEGLQTSCEIKNKVGKIYALYGLSQVAQQRGQSKEAIAFLKNALVLSEEIQSLLEQSVCLELLAEVYEAAGKPHLALQTYKRYKTIYQTMFDQKKQSSRHTLEITHRTQIAQLEAQIMQDKNEELVQLVADRVADLQASLEREKRLAHELQDALDTTNSINLLRETIIKTVSHQFRTPLTVLSVSSNLLYKRCHKLVEGADLERVEQYNQKIIDAILYLTQVMDGIVEVEQVNQTSMQFNPQVIEYDELHDLLQRKLQRQLPNFARLQFAIKPLHTQRLVSIDLMLFMRTMVIVVDNALKYSDPVTPICITAVLDGRILTVSVRNEGVGISAEELPQIWELFYRGKSVQYAQDGLGLGLFMAKHLVETMQGEITATSLGEEQGATFTICLPISKFAEDISN